MKLYKYKSLRNLWHVLDIVLNGRLHCAKWAELNDPFEGTYEIWLSKENKRIHYKMANRIEKDRDVWRIASLSADPTHILLWSHYADGHKGIAVEVDIPYRHAYLERIHYYPYSYPRVFTESSQTEYTMRHLFTEKGKEWEYEREYRVITKDRFFPLPTPVKRILIGPKADCEQVATLKKAVWRKGRKVKVLQMQYGVLEEQMRVFIPNTYLEKIACKRAFAELGRGRR